MSRRAKPICCRQFFAGNTTACDPERLRQVWHAYLRMPQRRQSHPSAAAPGAYSTQRNTPGYKEAP